MLCTCEHRHITEGLSWHTSMKGWSGATEEPSTFSTILIREDVTACRSVTRSGPRPACAKRSLTVIQPWQDSSDHHMSSMLQGKWGAADGAESC